LYHPVFYDWLIRNKLWIYGLLCLLLVGRNLVRRFLARAKRVGSDLPKRIRQMTTKTLKKVLMPFHRQFCFYSFYHNAHRATDKEGFGIYHAHDLNTLPVAYFSAKRDRAKLVYDSHELYTERNKLKPSSAFWKFILSRIEGFLVRQADAVFTVNTTLAGELAKRYKIPVPGVVMNTPTSFKNSEQRLHDNGRLRNELSVPPDKKLLLYIGAITFNRGLEELILSLKYLPDCYLVYMGYGHDAFKQNLLNLVETSRVADRFFFFGPVPSDQVIHYAAGAEMGVAPIANACLSYYCCSPNKLFEYMNAGLPVVASNFPELEKVVLGHDIGLTFDPADPQDIARVIRLILDDSKTMERMSNNAIKASRLYNWEIESKKLLSIYSKLKF
jgi:glycosyltransferase involved in cell wall biosynthesis